MPPVCPRRPLGPSSRQSRIPVGGTMSTNPDTAPASKRRGARLLRNPLIRIVVALLSIAIPFAIVATPFNLFVTDRFLRALGALLLTAVVLGAYCLYVRWVER